jgi:hypothetical protein
MVSTIILFKTLISLNFFFHKFTTLEICFLMLQKLRKKVGVIFSWNFAVLEIFLMLQKLGGKKLQH